MSLLDGKTAVVITSGNHGWDGPEAEAVVEATEEAALNALFMAETVTGRDGHVLHALPIDRTLDLLRGWHPI